VALAALVASLARWSRRPARHARGPGRPEGEGTVAPEPDDHPAEAERPAPATAGPDDEVLVGSAAGGRGEAPGPVGEKTR